MAYILVFADEKKHFFHHVVTSSNQCVHIFVRLGFWQLALLGGLREKALQATVYIFFLLSEGRVGENVPAKMIMLYPSLLTFLLHLLN